MKISDEIVREVLSKWFGVDYNSEYVTNHEHFSDIRAALEAVLPKLMVKVKPLEWIDTYGCDDYSATTPFGVYTISDDEKGWFFTFHDYPYGVADDERYDVFYLAQQAAQADYERRMLEGLEIVKTGFDVAAVREQCAKIADNFNKEFLNDAKLWKVENMKYAEMHSQSQAVSASMIASAIRALSAEPAQG